MEADVVIDYDPFPDWPVAHRCSVYLVFAEPLSPDPVYVGVADDFAARWRQHLRSSWWIGEVRVDHVTVLDYPTRECARQVEAVWINERHPRYNVAPELAAYRRFKATPEPSFAILRGRLFDADTLAAA